MKRYYSEISHTDHCFTWVAYYPPEWFKTQHIGDVIFVLCRWVVLTAARRKQNVQNFTFRSCQHLLCLSQAVVMTFTMVSYPCIGSMECVLCLQDWKWLYSRLRTSVGVYAV